MSKFLESFERFRNGTATEEETAIVREEISKHEAIEAYLTEQLDQAIPSAGEDMDVAAGKRIARRVRFKMVSVVLIVLFGIAALSAAAVAVCNAYYYDPNKGIGPVYGGDGQLLIDMWAFSELHSPGYMTVWAEAWRDGPGSYEVRIRQNSLFTGLQETASERIVRGRVLGNDDRTPNDYWHFPIGNAFGYREGSVLRVDEDGTEYRAPAAEDLAWQIEALGELPASSRAAVYVTFAHDLPLEAFAELYHVWNSQVGFLYAAVTSADGYMPNTVGFSPDGSGIVLENGPEEYPYFQLSGHYEELQSDPAAAWEQHFRAIVSYLAGRSQFLETMASVNGISPNYYNEVLDYIDQNGMQIYGVLITGSAADIRSFLESEDYLDFYVDGVRLSVLSNS